MENKEIPVCPIKAQCQCFTPKREVNKMLKIAGYSSENDIYNKPVLEHSFGDGRILVAIVTEYIKCGLRCGKSAENIASSLAENIIGFEVDRELYQSTIAKLNHLAERYGIPAPAWSVFHQDALEWDGKKQFNFIIGNPPYISYNDLDEATRKALKESYTTCCKGKYDYCYAFLEFSINHLSPRGKLVQLVPNSIYKNVYADQLRKLLQPHVSAIYLYPGKQLFHGTLTSSSIFLYDAEYEEDKVICMNMTNHRKIILSRHGLTGKWKFTESKHSERRLRFGDYFTAANAVATLYNEAFLVDEATDEIEEDVIRPAVSPKAMRYQKKQHIIFPYLVDAGRVDRYSEDMFERQFPKASNHLERFHKGLGDRKADKNARWFEYGRTQALQNILRKKLILSNVVTNKVSTYIIPEGTVSYAGIFIVAVSKQFNLNDAKKILESEDFLRYVVQIGTPAASTSIRITCKDINDYMFPEGVIYGAAAVQN